ncbi:MAG: DNA polymerase III subunit [Firmicutes bacterium]|nr:DNA polymerase III subunit [Bacillota bacterium]
MRFSAFIGQEGLLADLRKMVREGRIGHAYLFLGPEGIGRRTLATILAQALLCEEVKEGEPCDACRSCRLLQAGTHPDLVCLSAEAGTLRIEQIRSLRSQVAYKPLLAKKRVFLLAELEKMTEAAANSFLLTLEEPPRNVVFIGWALAGAYLLPTVLSRFQIFTMQPLSAGTLAEALMARGVEAERATAVAVEAEGLPGKAFALLAAEYKEDEERSWLRLFLTDDLLAVFQGIDNFSRGDREILRERLCQLEKLLGQSLIARVRGQEGPVGLEGFDEVSLRRLHKAVATAVDYLRANANVRLVLETLALAFYHERKGLGRGGRKGVD